MSLGQDLGKRTFLLQMVQSPINGVVVETGAENGKIWRLCLSLISISGDGKWKEATPEKQNQYQ